MVDYSKWDNFEPPDEEEEGLQCTFPYPLGQRTPAVKKFDVRPEACSAFDGVAHRDIVIGEAGHVATVIGVRRPREGIHDTAKGRLWGHLEGAPGAGMFNLGERLRVVARVPEAIPPGGHANGQAPSRGVEWLRPAFSYVCGLLVHSVERFDIRDEICLRVGGFKHGQVVQRPDDGVDCVVIGVRRDPADNTVALWIHHGGQIGAGIFDYEAMRTLVAIGSVEVQEVHHVPAGLPMPTPAWRTMSSALAALSSKQKRRRTENEKVKTSGGSSAPEAAAQLAAETATLVAQRAQLEKERQELYELSPEASGSDVIELNVGGTAMTTTRGTLCRAGEGSMLAAMFSGKWEQGHKRDAQGRIFLDADPFCFCKLLSLLRLRGIERPEAPLPPPVVPQDRRAEFLAVGAYYAAPLFEQQTMHSGSEVRLCGLKEVPELNDSLGWLLHFDPSVSQWRVLLRSGLGVSICEANLELIKGAPKFREIT